MWKYLRIFNSFIYPEGFYKLSSRLLPWVMVLTAVLFATGIYGALVSSPPDYQQGEGVRIIYIHVPAAFLSLAIYSFMAFSSACYLIWRIKLYDLFAANCAHLGAGFTLIALVSGSLWGKPMWGTWWIWDARLTSELILLFIYLGYIFLRKSLPVGHASAKACAVLAIVGFVDIPIIHYSVNWWHTLHQGSTLSLMHKPTITFDMLWPLLIMNVAFMGVFILIFLLNVKASILQQFGKQQWIKSYEL